MDDGGTANAALGEGMCRSATDEACLVEVDGDDVWITVRLLLQSNCNNVALYTRDGYDSYSKADYSITSEDAGNDSIDYRIKVTEPGQKLKCTMYVGPMGRDVLWYLYVDTSTLKSGSGDFVVNIDTSKPADAPASKPAAQTGGQAAAAKPSSGGSTTPATNQPAKTEAPKKAETKAENKTDTATDKKADAETADKDADEDKEAETQEYRIAAAEKRAAERRVNREANSSGDTSAENGDQGSSNAPLVGGILVVVLAAAGGVTYYIVRKKNKGNPS